VIADKAGIKDLTNKLVPLIRALSGVRKVFLIPLSRYWIDLCCGEPGHLSNYKTAGYLPSLGAATNVLKEFIRDSLYMRHTSNFRVLCPNKILEIRQRHAELAIKDASERAALWGSDPDHPSGAAYKVIADGYPRTFPTLRQGTRTPPKSVIKQDIAKKPRLDLSLERDAWVSGCMAALPRRDSGAPSLGQGMPTCRGVGAPTAIGNAGEPSTVELPSVAPSTPGVVGDAAVAADVVISILTTLTESIPIS
jgi:hypothetical protein